MIAASAATLQHRYPGLVEVGGTVGTAVSAAFLLAIAAANGAVLAGICRLLATARRGGAYRADELAGYLARRGFIARVLRAAVRG